MIPEILELIFQFLKPRDLVQCACVSHQWNHVAVSLIWRDNFSPRDKNGKSVGQTSIKFVKTLASLVHDPDRFRYYSSYVRHLQLNRLFEDSLLASLHLDDRELWRTFEPRIVRLGYEGSARASRLPFYSSSLRSLRIGSICHIHPICELFGNIMLKCPNLEFFSIFNIWFFDQDDIQYRLPFIVPRRLKFLETGRLSEKEKVSYLADIWTHVFENQELLFIFLPDIPLPSRIPTIVSAPKLKYLGVKVDANSDFSAVVPYLKELECLRVYFGPPYPLGSSYRNFKTETILAIHTNCRQLRHLYCKSAQALDLDDECFRRLGSSGLPLESLSFRNSDEKTGPNISLMALETISLATLQGIDLLSTEFPATARTMVEIGKRCPKLLYLIVSAVINLSELYRCLDRDPGSLDKLERIHAGRWQIEFRIPDGRTGRPEVMGYHARSSLKYMPSLKILSADFMYKTNGPLDENHRHRPEWIINHFIRTECLKWPREVPRWTCGAKLSEWGAGSGFKFQAEYRRNLDKKIHTAISGKTFMQEYHSRDQGEWNHV